MTKQQKLGAIFGSLGGAIGAVTWLVIIGIQAQTPWLIILPIAYGIIGWIMWSVLAVKFPNRYKLIFGLFILWFMIFNFVVGNIVYSCGYISSHTLRGVMGGFDGQRLNMFIGIFSLIGLVLVAKDFSKSEKLLRTTVFAIIILVAIGIGYLFFLENGRCRGGVPNSNNIFSPIPGDIVFQDPLINENISTLMPKSSAQGAFETYKNALGEKNEKIYSSDLLTDASKEMFASRSISQSSMENEFSSIYKPYSINESGNYAVVVFEANNTNSSPYFIQKTDKGWQVDLYTMMRAIKFDSSNNWHLVPGEKHPYLFAFESAVESGSEQSTCEQKGGRWGRIGNFSPNEECDLPAPDGGKICSDASQCESYNCIAKLTEEEKQTVISGTVIRTTGICTTWASETFGCKARVEKGKVSGILCAD